MRDPAIGWTWPEACALLARAEHLHRQFFHLARASDRHVVWEPPVDVLETERQVLILVGLPGVNPESVEAAIEGNALIVTGNRSLPQQLNGAIIHRLELPHGRFERTVPLPHGRYGDVQSASAHGCLVVTLAKII